MVLVSCINKWNSDVLWREISGSAVLGKPEETTLRRYLNPRLYWGNKVTETRAKKTAAGKSEIKIQLSAQKKALSSQWSFG